MESNNTFDVLVIGGGPAGMMAAGRAAEIGRSVLLLEKNSTLGKKLLITGGGRCNLTNNKQNIHDLAKKYKGSEKFLMSALSQFDVVKTLDFFNSRGMETKEEVGNRIFPVSNKSKSVLDVLVKYLKEGKVVVKTNSDVLDVFLDEKKEYFIAKLKNGNCFKGKNCIVSTGGVSHPETGSTGDGFLWLKKMGHKIIDNNFALVPIALKEEWVKKISGLTFEDIKLTVFLEGKKQHVSKGRLLFTHFGISGPMVLNMSKDIGDLISYGEVTILLDLFPKTDHGTLRQNLQKILVEDSNKKLKNTLNKIIPSAFVPVLLEMSGVNGETENHSIRHEERITLVKKMKEISMTVKELLGADKAIVSSGGISLEEVNFKTMQSKIIPQLYITGDIININRPSGGYSLQLCWTTGFIAGNIS